ncbi:MAG: FecR domain-containing protein [Nitrospirota bacterium]
MAFGEIKSTGGVEISSSTGKWSRVPDIYPLFKSSKIRTSDGVVFITTKDGARIDLAQATEVSIEAAQGNYSVALEKGTVLFAVPPSASLTVTTKEATVSVTRQTGGYYSLVAGPGAPSFKNIQGMIIRGPEGTFIRSLHGGIAVSGPALEARILNTGERLFASLEGEDKALGYTPAENGLNDASIQLMITGAFITGAGVTALDSYRGDGVHSPAGFIK